MSADTAFIVGNALAVGLDLQERFPKGSEIHAEGENIAAACRNILRLLPFEMAKAGQIGPPQETGRRHLRVVAPVDDPAIDV